MKITIWGINYAPEVTGIAPYNVKLAEFLQSQGHDVRMLTTFAYYPAWRKAPEDRGVLYRTDRLEGVPVHRCWHFVPQKVTALKRIVHEATFVLSSWLRLFFLPRPEVLVVVSPPLLLGAAARLFGVIRNVPFVFHVQDLQPDAAVGLGMLKAGAFTRALYRLEALAYAGAARVCGISRGMLAAFRRKQVPEERITYFPNPVTLPKAEDLPPSGSFRARQGWTGDEFLAVYSGNLGVKQGLQILLEAAALCGNPRVRMVICGDGADRERLTRLAADRRLTNVTFLPLQSAADYAAMLADADVCLITQQAGSGQSFFPSKLLTTLGFARPVLSVADADSELALALSEGGFGVNVLPGDAAALARAIEKLAAAPEELRQMGERGREYVRQYEADPVLRGFEQVLCEVVEEQRRKLPR
jgi:colanic acid biosynthesis glycosyl transferase WcaI